MFLNALDEKQKTYFLELAHYAAYVDQNLVEQEMMLLKSYRDEMRMQEYKIQYLPLDEILSEFKTKVEQNIVFLEILGLLLVDFNLSEAENALIFQIQQAFGIDDTKKKLFETWVKEIIQLYERGKALINTV